MKNQSGILRRTIVYRILAIAFGAAAIYHLVALSPGIFPPSPFWRHYIFIFLNIVGSVLAARRWIWLWIPFTVLTIQQFISHGLRAYEWWTFYHRIDTISILIIVCMPFIAVFLFNDFKSRMKSKL